VHPNWKLNPRAVQHSPNFPLPGVLILSNVNPTNYFSLAVSSGAGKKKKEIQKPTQQSHNQEITLTNKFQKLPDKLTTKIFSKLEDEPKTLIRCTAVCKNWASFVSETVNLSLRFSSLRNEGLSIPCSKLHYHAHPTICNPCYHECVCKSGIFRN
jgi:hypothetical protein